MQQRSIKNLIIIAGLQIIGFIFMVPFMVASDSNGQVDNSALYGTLIGFLILIVSQIYFVYWYYQTSVEIRSKGFKVPVFILYFIPFANFYWLWKYSEGVEGVTKSKLQTIVVFLINLLAGIPLAPIVLQYYFNRVPVAKKVQKVLAKPKK